MAQRLDPSMLPSAVTDWEDVARRALEGNGALQALAALDERKPHKTSRARLAAHGVGSTALDIASDTVKTLTLDAARDSVVAVVVLLKVVDVAAPVLIMLACAAALFVVQMIARKVAKTEGM